MPLIIKNFKKGEKTMKKTIALILVSLMLLAFAVPTVTATEATASNFISYESAKDGQLLGTVDFGKVNLEVLNKSDTLNTTVVVNGGELKITPAKGTPRFTYNTGMTLSELPISDTSVYTIDFSMATYAGSLARYIYFNNDCQNGFIVTKTYASASGKNGDKVGDNIYYADLEGGAYQTNYDTNHLRNYFRVVLDAKNRKMSLYNLASNQTDYNFIAETTYAAPENNCLQLAFGVANHGSAGRAGIFENVNIYKGDLFNPVAEELVKAITFDDSWETLKDSETPPSTITPNGGEIKIAIPANDTRFDCVVGKSITDVKVDATSKYTIDFAMSTYADLARYIYFDKAFSCGFTVLKGQASKASNFSSTGTVVYEDMGITTQTSLHSANHTTTYYRVTLDAAAEKLELYVLSTNGWVKVLENNGYEVPEDGCLTLVFGGRNHKTAGRNAIFSDVNIYEGHYFAKNTVDVIDGETTTTLELDKELFEYTLPKESKVGFMFKGWKVNGSEDITKSGEKVPTATLETLEKVFVPVMSDVRWQAMDNGNGSRDVRFVSAIDSLNYTKIGYNVTIKYQDKSFDKNGFDLKHVYTSLLASYGSDVVTLETLGYDNNDGYITAFVIKNVPTDVGDITVELTPYQAGPDGEPVMGDKVTKVLTVEDLTK